MDTIFLKQKAHIVKAKISSFKFKKKGFFQKAVTNLVFEKNGCLLKTSVKNGHYFPKTEGTYCKG